MRCGIKQSSNIELIFPFPLLDKSVCRNASNHWAQFNQFALVLVQLDREFPKHPAEYFFALRLGLLVNDFGVFPGVAVVQ